MLFIPALIIAAVSNHADGTHDLDFWLGTWDLETTVVGPDGKEAKGKGSNKISRILESQVIQEQFDMPSLKGISVSVFSQRDGVWRQTWVDNQGGYIPLTGGKQGNDFVLTTPVNPRRPNASNRMTFYNITRDSFDWKWEGSLDGGKTWKNTFSIHYARRKGSK